MNVFLIGYRGTGKSTVGRMLAGRLGWKFVDSDELIVEEAGRNIAEIFSTVGEAAFRQRESEVVARLAAGDRVVVALGGGAILREENRKALKDRGPVVWLAASPEILAERLRTDAQTATQRPSLTGQSQDEEIRQVLEQREPLYRQSADLQVDTEGKTPAEVVDAILSSLGDRLPL